MRNFGALLWGLCEPLFSSWDFSLIHAVARFAQKKGNDAETQQSKRQSNDFRNRQQFVRLIGRGDDRENNCNERRRKTKRAESDCNRLASGNPNYFGRRRLALKSNQRSEDKQVRNEVRNDAHADQNFVCAVDAGSSLAQKDKNYAAEGLHEQRDIRCAPLRMNACERGRKVSVESRYERQARRNSEPGPKGPEIADRNQQRRQRCDPGEAYAFRGF